VRRPQTVRVAAVQYQLRAITSFDEFAQQVEYFVDVVADYKADLRCSRTVHASTALDRKQTRGRRRGDCGAHSYTTRFREMMSRLAVSYNVNIIGARTRRAKPTAKSIMSPMCSCATAASMSSARCTPPRTSAIGGISRAATAPTSSIRLRSNRILICYDCEFPELVRHVIDQGAAILFVPFCTDERQSYMRVRYCAQARAVENQCFVVMAGNVGNLPKVENMDIQYSQSCVLTPCDFPFARDGIASDTTPNVEMVAIADLQLDNLRAARQGGTVQNLKDRRFDLYSVTWRGR